MFIDRLYAKYGYYVAAVMAVVNLGFFVAIAVVEGDISWHNLAAGTLCPLVVVYLTMLSRVRIE